MVFLDLINALIPITLYYNPYLHHPMYTDLHFNLMLHYENHHNLSTIFKPNSQLCKVYLLLTLISYAKFHPKHKLIHSPTNTLYGNPLSQLELLCNLS